MPQPKFARWSKHPPTWSRFSALSCCDEANGPSWHPRAPCSELSCSWNPQPLLRQMQMGHACAPGCPPPPPAPSPPLTGTRPQSRHWSVKLVPLALDTHLVPLGEGLCLGSPEPLARHRPLDRQPTAEVMGNKRVCMCVERNAKGNKQSVYVMQSNTSKSQQCQYSISTVWQCACVTNKGLNAPAIL